jgi:hypothetical protein
MQRRGKLEMSGVSIENCDSGVEAEDWNGRRSMATLTNVQVTGSEGAALKVGRLRLANVTLDNNPGHGIYGGTLTQVRASGLTITNNAYSDDCQYYGCAGITAGSVKGDALYIADNAGLGIHSVALNLADSIVVRNVRAGSPRDLVIGEFPKVDNVVCTSSSGWGSKSSTPWGVCSLD